MSAPLPPASAPVPAHASAPSFRASLPHLPLVGREREMQALDARLDAAAAGRGSTVFLAGDSGTGKSRLVEEVSALAARRGMTVLGGRSYAVEQGTPYAPFADALVPLIRSIERGKLAALTRGGEAELSLLFPALGTRATAPRGDSPEIRTRQYWTLAQLLAQLSSRAPIILAIEDIHWADASSIELLHFLARQNVDARIGIIATYTTGDRDRHPALRAAEQSLHALGVARTLVVPPLDRDATETLLREVFGADPSVIRDFTAVLHAWTRGNPFFIEEILVSLVESGRLSRQGGAWVGWDAEQLQLPRSIRDAVIARVDRLPDEARAIAEWCAVLGAPVTHSALARVTSLKEEPLLAAVAVLRSQAVLDESETDGEIQYELAHPILAQTLYESVGLARSRQMHRAIAEALERHYGTSAEEHAAELATHLVRSDAPDGGDRAWKYQARAGRDALRRHANREAAQFLQAAADRLGGRLDGAAERAALDDLARARQRLGEYDAARIALERLRDDAVARKDHSDRAVMERRLGLTSFWSGRYDEALAHYAAALEAAKAAGDRALAAKIHLNAGICLQELGRPHEALSRVKDGLVLAAELGETALLARVHRALLLLHLWTGPANRAREHGLEAIRLAEESEQGSLAFQAHWGMAVLGGLTGDAGLTRRHLDEAERLADELHSPVLRVWSGEIAIEYLSFTGDWDAGLALGEQTIALARTLARPLLPRLLVWTALIYIGRGEMERARRYVDEAWALAMGGASSRGVDVHAVVPAHTGMAAFHLASGEYDRALEVGRAGVAIADRTGYVVWALHRLLPIVAEASLWASDVNGAAWTGRRLRRDAERLGQKLGLAWADTCDALVGMVRGGNRAGTIQVLREAAEELEAIPFVADGARVRRQLARAMVDAGDRDGAMRELRRAHDVFARLGAKGELDATREQLRELGARPPARSATVGTDGLTGREIEIIRLVAERKSNREIGESLGISPRTVSTHLSNIFGKLQLGSRGELTDFYRERLRHQVAE